MKVMVDQQFAEKMPWYAKFFFSVAMYCLDITMKLSGMEESKK